VDVEAVQAYERLQGIVLASEEWSPLYKKIPEQHAELIKLTARLQRQIMVYFRQLAVTQDAFINWYNYHTAVHAYTVDVIINSQGLDQSDTQFIKIIFDTLTAVHTLGAVSAGIQFKKDVALGLDPQSQIIQQLTTEQVANLVGKRVDKETGRIIDNPNPAYSIDETTRNRIAQSIKTSINLGETQEEAASRLSEMIADPKRAALIARTETVRAFGAGRNAFGIASDATGKQWSDSNAVDECADNTAQGIIPIGQDFVSGDEFEPAHPNCKCLVRYVYADEYNPVTEGDLSEADAIIQEDAVL
jgi:hypothetical protein